jgi:hypothetical protein
MISDGLRAPANEDERPSHLTERVMHHDVAPLARFAVFRRQLAELAEVLPGVELVAGIDDRPADVVVCAPMHVASDRDGIRPPGGNRAVITVER